MAPLIAQNGEISAGIEYVAKQQGHWIAVPACVGSPTLPSSARIDLFKEYLALDLTAMYRAGKPANNQLADTWTWDFFLTAAEKCFKAGHGPSDRRRAWCHQRFGQLGRFGISQPWCRDGRPGR